MQSEKVSQLIELFFTSGGKVDADIIPVLGKKLVYLSVDELEAVISAIIWRIGSAEKQKAAFELAEAA